MTLTREEQALLDKRRKTPEEIREYGFILLPACKEFRDIKPEHMGMMLQAVAHDILGVGEPVEIPPLLEDLYKCFYELVVCAPYEEYSD